jgi:predicted transcriptional regulator
MTRTYVLRRLLEHGGLTTAELLEITGWRWGSVRSALTNLMATGTVEAVPAGPHRNIYVLA